MKKLLIFYWIMFILPLAAFSQSVDLQWLKQTSEPSSSIVYNTNVVNFDGVGNAYQAGSFDGTTSFDTGVSLSTSGGRDMFLLKRNTNGVLQWIKQINSNGEIECRAINIDNSNNIIITGYFSGTAYFSSGVSLTTGDNYYNAFIAKYDNNGNLLWAKHIYSGYWAMGYGLSLDNSGIYILWEDLCNKLLLFQVEEVFLLQQHLIAGKLM